MLFHLIICSIKQRKNYKDYYANFSPVINSRARPVHLLSTWRTLISLKAKSEALQKRGQKLFCVRAIEQYEFRESEQVENLKFLVFH